MYVSASAGHIGSKPTQKHPHPHTVVEFEDGIEIIGFDNQISDQDQDHLTERGNHPLETSLLSYKPHAKFNSKNNLGLSLDQ